MDEATDSTKTVTPPASLASAAPASGGESVEPGKVESKLADQQDNEAPANVPLSSWTTCWLSDRDITTFTLLAAVLLALIAYRWAELSGWGMREVEIERLEPLAYNFRLNPNEASWVELAQLDGVGETLAVRIVEDRETNGPFRTLDDLDRVKGIGEKTLARLKPYLHISGQDVSE